MAVRPWAHLEQTRIARRFAGAFADCDLLLAPVSPLSPFPWTQLYAETVDGHVMCHYYEWLGLTYFVTLATNPALSLPCGRDGQGMPFGLQVIAPLRADGALLAGARALERLFDSRPELCRPRPDPATLREPRPELRAIVTHPPVFGSAASAAGTLHAV